MVVGGCSGGAGVGLWSLTCFTIQSTELEACLTMQTLDTWGFVGEGGWREFLVGFVGQRELARAWALDVIPTPDGGHANT